MSDERKPVANFAMTAPTADDYMKACEIRVNMIETALREEAALTLESCIAEIRYEMGALLPGEAQILAMMQAKADRIREGRDE